MIIKRLVLVLGVIALASAPALSQCDPEPLDGTYMAPGTLLPGRVSEAWCTIMSPGVPGNTENAMSWDGTNLGTQWHVWGMAIDAAGPIETAQDIDENGDGWIDYSTNYDGGFFWLAGTGPWGGPPAGFTGYLTFYNVGTRVELIGWQIVGSTSNVFFTGIFDDCPNCAVEYTIANAMLVWMTGWPNQPANYPGFLCGASCGEYFDACCIMTKIHCTPVATEPSTWGMIKGFYR
jgi:hypothetical protein